MRGSVRWLRRNWSGSTPALAARMSMCDSRAKVLVFGRGGAPRTNGERVHAGRVAALPAAGRFGVMVGDVVDGFRIAPAGRVNFSRPRRQSFQRRSRRSGSSPRRPGGRYRRRTPRPRPQTSLDRFAGGLSQARGFDGLRRSALAAKATAHIRRDDMHVLRLHAESLRHRGLHREGAWCWPTRWPCRFRCWRRRVGFDRRVRHVAVEISLVHDGLGKASRRPQRCRPGPKPVVSGRFRAGGRRWSCRPGPVCGRSNCAWMRPSACSAMSGALVEHGNQVAVAHHANAGQFLSGAGVDALQGCAVCRGTENPRVEHPRKSDVAGVFSLAGDLFEGILAARRLPMTVTPSRASRARSGGAVRLRLP